MNDITLLLTGPPGTRKTETINLVHRFLLENGYIVSPGIKEHELVIVAPEKRPCPNCKGTGKV